MPRKAQGERCMRSLSLSAQQALRGQSDCGASTDHWCSSTWPIIMCAHWYNSDINLPWTRPYLCQVKQSKPCIRCPANSHTHAKTHARRFFSRDAGVHLAGKPVMICACHFSHQRAVLGVLQRSHFTRGANISAHFRLHPSTDRLSALGEKAALTLDFEIPLSIWSQGKSAWVICIEHKWYVRFEAICGFLFAVIPLMLFSVGL